MAMFTEGELVPLARRLGFDATAAPPWVMVQAGSAKIVSLKDGSGLSLQLRSVWDPSSSGVVTFQENAGINTRRIVLTAKGAGTVFLEAVDATGRTQATLEITVKEKMTLHVFSHFVFEKSGRMGSTGPDEARQMVEVANKLYLPQANIELVLDGSGPCRLPFDMDRGLPIHLPPFNAPRRWLRNTPAGPLPCIASRTPDARGCLPEEVQGPLKTLEDFKALRKYQIICNIVGNIDPGWDYHIFFVRSLDQEGSPFITGAYTPSNLKSIAINACFIPNAGARGQVLAHEFGHYLLRPGTSFLGPDGHSHGTNDLMQEHPGPDDLRIPKLQSNYMNVSGIQYGTW